MSNFKTKIHSTTLKLVSSSNPPPSSLARFLDVFGISEVNEVKLHVQRRKELAAGPAGDGLAPSYG